MLNLSHPENLTHEAVARLLASGDDSSHSQLRVRQDGHAFLSKVVGDRDTEGLAFRFETFSAGAGCVGPDAATDTQFVARITAAIAKNWPSPSVEYIDSY